MTSARTCRGPSTASSRRAFPRPRRRDTFWSARRIGNHLKTSATREYGNQAATLVPDATLHARHRHRQSALFAVCKDDDSDLHGARPLRRGSGEGSCGRRRLTLCERMPEPLSGFDVVSVSLLSGAHILFRVEADEGDQLSHVRALHADGGQQMALRPVRERGDSGIRATRGLRRTRAAPRSCAVEVASIGRWDDGDIRDRRGGCQERLAGSDDAFVEGAARVDWLGGG